MAKNSLSYHVHLPRNTSLRGEEELHYVIPDLQCCSGGTAPGHLGRGHRRQVSIIGHHVSPLSRLQGSVSFGVRKGWWNIPGLWCIQVISVSQIVVEHNTCLHHIHHFAGVEIYGSSQDPPPSNQNAKSVFNYTSSSAEPVIEYLLLQGDILSCRRKKYRF